MILNVSLQFRDLFPLLLLWSTRQLPWTPVPSEADGYVANATSNRHTVTQQVKGGSQNEMTLNSRNGDPYKTCTCTTGYNQFIKVINDCWKYNNNL